MLFRYMIVIMILLVAIWFWFGTAFAAPSDFREIDLENDKEVVSVLKPHTWIFAYSEKGEESEPIEGVIFTPKNNVRMFLLLPNGAEMELANADFNEKSGLAEFVDVEEKVHKYSVDELSKAGKFYLAFRGVNDKSGVKFLIE